MAQLQGMDSGATSRFSGGAGRYRVSPDGGGRHRLSGSARPRPEADRRTEPAVRLRQARARTFREDARRLRRVRFRQELLSGHAGHRPHQGKAAGLDLAGPVDDAAVLRDLDTAWHSQGGARRHALRHMDVGGRHRRLRHSKLPVRGSSRRPVCGRVILADFPAARTDVGQLERAVVRRESRRLFLAHRAAGHRHDDRRFRHVDVPHEEFVPRRDPQAIRADRAHERPDGTPGSLWPRVPQRHADRDRRLSRAPSSAPSSPGRC